MNSKENEAERQVITSWITEILTNPDKKLANAILPILVEEFESFNNQRLGDCFEDRTTNVQ
jgi:hypothetical protein